MASPIWQRMQPNVIKAGDCLAWIGPYKSGGRLPVFSNKTRKHPQSVRQAVVESLGAAVEGMRVFPTCGNHRCVNPEHYIVKALDTYNDEERPKIPAKPRIELTCLGPAGMWSQLIRS